MFFTLTTIIPAHHLLHISYPIKHTYVGQLDVTEQNYPKDIIYEELDEGTAVFYQHTEGHPMVACKYRAIKDTSGGKSKGGFHVVNLPSAYNGTNRKVDQRR